MNKNDNITILIIEDDKSVSDFIELELKFEKYNVHKSYDGISGLVSFRQLKPDLIILDRILPQIDGIEICRRIRESSDVPIIILSAKNTLIDKITGLDAGANDYITKPFDLEELTARIRVQLRIRKPLKKTLLYFSDIVVNINTREVKRNNITLNLSPKEYELLLILIKTPNHVISKRCIFEFVWGIDFEGEENILDVYIHSLREKLEINSMKRLIFNVRGVGYILKES
ncbi:MAG: response regulator transcription factor [Candidatus Sericytochromatia bacterium]